jgi:hypothetical protein
MHEVIHQWSDGYGASLTFTYIPGSDPGPLAAYVTLTSDAMDVYADAADLRAIAATALAMAEAIEADATKKRS